MKKRIIVLIILILVVASGVVVYNCLDKKNNKPETELDKLVKKKVERDELLSITYSNSGDLRGSTYIVEFKIDTMTITESSSESTSSPFTVKEYKVPSESKHKIEEYIDKYNFPAWYDLPETDYRIYDAPVKVFTFDYDNKKIGGASFKTYKVYFDRKMEEETSKVLVEFRDYFLTLLDEKYKVNEYTKKR